MFAPRGNYRLFLLGSGLLLLLVLNGLRLFDSRNSRLGSGHTHLGRFVFTANK